MYFFLSHSSKDDDIVKGVVSALQKYNVSYWLDSKEIKYGTKIASTIEDGIDNCTHFLLIWSKNAKNSDSTIGVKAEIDLIKTSQYKNIHKIVLKKDDANLPIGLADNKYVRISDENAEEITSKVIEEHRPSLEKQFSDFKNKVVLDYENFKPTKEPMIMNFLKFDGYKHYVSQNYVKMSKEIKIKKDETEEEKIKEEITLTVEKEILEKTPKIIPVVSEYGSGKSSLCHNIMYKLCNLKDTFPIFIPLGDIGQKDERYNYDSFKNIILQYIQKEYHLMISKKEFELEILKGSFIFILDAIDEMSFKTNDEINQNNLEQIIKLSTKNRILLTSRHNYLSENNKKQLINHHDIFIIQEFNESQKSIFLRKKFSQNQIKTIEVDKVIRHHKLEDIAKKPLFLATICDNLDNFKQNSSRKIVNEATIMQMLTDNWIKYDVQTKNIPKNKQRMKIIYRQRCSEILAIAETRNDNKPISKYDIQEQVNNELGSENDAHLDEYFRDAKDCTFLVPHGNNSFKYILNSIKEYFVARRIINDINTADYQKTISDITIHPSDETIKFIQKIIQIEWAIQPHVFEEINIDQSNQYYSELLKFENKTYNILKFLDLARKDPEKPSVGVLVEILRNSGKMSKQVILTKLNLHGGYLEDVDLTTVDLRSANLVGANLVGANLAGASLEGASLKKVNLMGANLAGANLAGASLEGTDLCMSNLTNADFDGANLSTAKNLPTTTNETKKRSKL